MNNQRFRSQPPPTPQPISIHDIVAIHQHLASLAHPSEKIKETIIKLEDCIHSFAMHLNTGVHP